MANTVYTTAPNGFSFLRDSNGTPPLEWKTVGATAVKTGDALTIASGLLVIETGGSSAILGIAQADTAAGDECPYIPANDDTLFTAELTAAAASITTLMGVAVDITGGTGAQAVLATAGGTPQMRILGWVREYDPGTGNTNTNGRVIVAVYKGQYNTQVI